MDMKYAEEIRDHIESQIEDNLSEEMTFEEAEKNAVTDMGDPVEVGISLDRIHNYRRVAAFHSSACSVTECKVRISYAGVFMFGTSVRQRNELGMVMGFGCGMIILLNISLNFAGIFGWIPLTSTFLPFLSFGRNNILLCYALVGIILSIYRYKDVYPKKFKVSKVSL